MLIHNKDDIQEVTEFFWDTLYDNLHFLNRKNQVEIYGMMVDVIWSQLLIINKILDF